MHSLPLNLSILGYLFGIQFSCPFYSLIPYIDLQNFWTYSKYATNVHLNHSNYIYHFVSKLTSCQFHNLLQGYHFIFGVISIIWTKYTITSSKNFTLHTSTASRIVKTPIKAGICFKHRCRSNGSYIGSQEYKT